MADGLLSGKFAIITGAGRGMGRAMARAFAAAGAAGVCVTSGSSLGEIRKVADEIDDIAGRKGTGLAITADVRERAACAHAVEQAARSFGALHILVNNAGLGMKNVGASRSAFWDCDPDGWEKLMGVNVNGPFHMARAAAKHLIAAGWGRIINVSKSADTMHSARNSPYGPSKAALEAMTICWAQDLLGTGVTANVILPGGLTNTMFSRSTAVPRARESGKAVYEPEDIAPLAVVLASSASDAYAGCRFNARGWRDDIPTLQALEACRTEPVFPRPRRPRELMTAWQPLGEHA